jgi:Flp pilus assembly pilin Flp
MAEEPTRRAAVALECAAGEAGQTLVEYALLVTFIAMVALAAIALLGVDISGLVHNVAIAL